MNRDTIERIAGEIQTPAYVFHLDELAKRFHKIEGSLKGRAQLCYAMKANPFLAGAMNEYAGRFEVCSPGEFRICERNHIPMEKIVVSGVNKEDAEMERVIREYEGKGIFTIESASQLSLLQEKASQENRKIQVLLRISSGSQFGVGEEEACQMIKERATFENLEFLGIQYYSGTQKKKLSKIEKELQYLDKLICKLKSDYGYEVQELEYGPGFYIPYFINEESDEETMLNEFAGILERMDFKGQITLEMGRFLAAMCGYYYTAVVDTKENNGEKFCIVDGGINHVNYYGQMMAMKIPHTQFVQYGESGKEELWNICGSLCTTGDVLIKQLPLQNPEVNDILVFERLGAYSVTEGIYLFLSRDLPYIMFYSEKNGIKMVRERQATDQWNSV